MTTISVAMATYNGARFIREQLDSLAAQTFRPLELVITDDGSTDDTLAIVENFAKNSPFPVKVHRNPERLGYGTNFMRCANLCRGDLIAFCDQDDIWIPKKLETCASALHNDEAYMVYHNAWIFKGRDTILKRLYRSQQDFRPTKPLSMPFSFCALGFTIVFRRSLLVFTDLWHHSIDSGDHNKEMSHDQWISFIANVSGPVLYLHNTLAMYRLHENNVSLNKDGRLKRLISNILLSASRANGSYRVYSKLADVLVSSDKHNSDHLGGELKDCLRKKEGLGSMGKDTFRFVLRHKCSSTNFEIQNSISGKCIQIKISGGARLEHYDKRYHSRTDLGRIEVIDSEKYAAVSLFYLTSGTAAMDS